MKQQTPSLGAQEAMRLFSAGQIAAATEACRKALAVRPTDADAINVLGVIEARQGRLGVATAHMEQVVKLRPKSAEAHYNFACALHQTGDKTKAEHHYMQALRLDPNHVNSLNNLGTIRQDHGDLAAARQVLERARALDPGNENAVVNLYGIYRGLAAFEQMELLAQQALQRWPTNAQHWLNRGEALFNLGRFNEAWECFEWRFQASTSPVVARAIAGVPAWRGESLEGKSLLVWTEQGPGDEIMFATMIRDIQRLVGKLSLLCSPRMRPLLARSFPDIEVLDSIAPNDDLGRFDFQAPLVNLAKLVRRDIASFAANTAFLVPERDLTTALRSSYRGQSNAILIGIAWRSSGVTDAQFKTINLGYWGALFGLPGVRFVNLQYGDCAQELSLVKTEFGAEVLQDPTVNPLADLDRFAAQVAAMDAVVCSSNTAAHVAGALGVPTYCMIPQDSSKGRRWYWFEREGRCAWYPALTLVRQKRTGEWVETIRTVTLRLTGLVHERGSKEEEDVGAFLLRLARAYNTSGDAAGASESLEALAELPGQEPRAYLELSHLAKERGDSGESERLLDRALSFQPDWWEALNQKGALLAARGAYGEAEVLYRRALQSNPSAHELHNNLGTSLRRQGRGIEADQYYKTAHVLAPDHVGILLNLATNLSEIGQNEEALPYFDRLLQLTPDYAEAHYSRGFCLLTAGRFAEGWPELRWRHVSLRNDERPPADRPPPWQGGSLSGKTVLVWTEHGLGDEILILSMLPDVLAAARQVTVGCSDRLISVVRRSFPGIRVVPRSRLSTIDVSGFDYQLTMSEMGQGFRSSASEFPARRSFLVADSARRQVLRARYMKSPGDFVIGLSWASSNPDIGNLKNLNLGSILVALAGVEAGIGRKVLFLNLQYGDCRAPLSEAKQKSGIAVIDDLSVDKGGDMDAFAAQVAAVDAVVTISNTTAHFSGALGIPTYLLLPYNRGRQWYWLRSQANCLWYPAVRYFIQKSDGDWDSALRECRAALQQAVDLGPSTNANVQ